MNSNAVWLDGEEPVPQEQVETQCFGCLSSNRKLSKLGDNLPLFSLLFNNQYSMLDKKVLLCWECGAQLKKARLFKEKVESAQQLLCFSSKEQKKFLSSLIVSTEVWTIGEVPQETIQAPENLLEKFNKPMANILNIYPETDTRKSQRLEKIEQENPTPMDAYKKKKKYRKKDKSPATLPVSFRQPRKCKQVVPVDPTLKDTGEVEIKSEILEDEESFDNYAEADYDEEDIKDEDNRSGQIKPKVEPNTDCEQTTSLDADNPIIDENLSEDDFEWPLEEEENASDETKSDCSPEELNSPEKLEMKRGIESEIEKTDNEGDSDYELSPAARKFKKLKKCKEEEDPDFEVSVHYTQKSKRMKEQASETTEKKRGRKKKEIGEEPFHLPYKRGAPPNTQTTRVTMKRVTVSLLEEAVLLEQDRNSDVFDKLWSNRCKKCVKVIPVDKTKQHIIDHKQSEDKCHLCNLCELPFSSEEAKTEHMTSAHTSALQCTKCDFKCTLLEVMAAHLWGHRQQMHQCLECNEQYDSKEEFYKHFCICDICEKPYKSKKILITHMYYRHLPHKCKYCNKIMKNYKTYETHFRTQHKRGPITEDAYCVACDKQFVNRILYHSHIETSKAHMGERIPRPGEQRKDVIYKCSECPNTYKVKESLKRHCDYVHKKEFHFKCKKCDKVYSKKGGLKDHIEKFHEGKQPVKNKFCNICGRGFSSKDILENHIRTHTGERPFKCEYCDSSFAQRVALQYHIKHIHLKVKRKPYVPKTARASQNVASGSQHYVPSGSQQNVLSGSESHNHNVIVDNVPDCGPTYSGYASGFYGYQ